MYFCLEYLFLLITVFVLKTRVNGFFRNCAVNQTLIVQKGSCATFSSEVIQSQNVSLPNENIIYYLLSKYDFVDFVDISDPWRENRTEYRLRQKENVSAILHNVEKEDNGTYYFKVDRTFYCYALFVQDVNSMPDGVIKEHNPAYFYGNPKSSDFRSHRVNATIMWFVDGKNVSQDPRFLLQDDWIWMASVSRALNGKNITYRVVQDNGSTSEANYTVQVTFGPEAPLQFFPNKAHYFLNRGEKMPDVSCFVDCNPACTISWDRFGKGHILSLGQIRSTMTGDYICMAIRPGMDFAVNRTLTIHVTDSSTFTMIAIAVLACVQAVMIITLGFCGVFIYKRSGLKTSSSQRSDANLYETEMQRYEVLESGPRSKAPVQLYEQCQAQEQYYTIAK